MVDDGEAMTEESDQAVTVSSQEISDGKVTIDSVVSAQDGWIVIHADDGTGAPGAVIGQSTVSAGDNADVAIQIDTAQATSTLFAMLHLDAGVIGVYEFPGADAPVSVDGAVLVTGFQTGTTEGESIGISEGVTVEVTSATVTVEMSASGFSPNSLTISAGDTVNFVTTDSTSRWPASFFHPTHKNYPGSAFSKCGSGEVIFDACEGISQTESFSFTFDEVGTWGYHDHQSAGTSGTIIVQ